MSLEPERLADFWEDPSGDDPLTPQLLADSQQGWGCRYPAAYVQMMQQQNGGIPRRRFFPLEELDDLVEISELYGITREDSGIHGGRSFWVEDWGYPDLGVPLCGCPSDVHDAVFLDYSLCGPQGEPRVVHIDQECDYSMTVLADSFEAFIRGLTTEEGAERRLAAARALRQARAEARQQERPSMFQRLKNMLNGR